MKYPDTIEKPVIGVIIVNYNNYTDTVRFIREDLLKQEDVILSIVIVENNSPNESWEILNHEFSENDQVHLIKNNINSGYSGGINLGIGFYENSGCEYILVTNNDIEIDDDYLLNKLIEEYKKLMNVAFVSPLMLVNGTISKKHYAWKLPTKVKEILDSTFFLKFLGHFYLSKFYYHFRMNEKELIIVDCLPGSFFIGKKDTFRIMGGLDENIFLYYEETVIGSKVKALKMNNYLIPTLRYNHFQEYSINTSYSCTQKHKLLLDSKIFYWKKYKDAGILFISLLQILFYINVAETIILKPFRIVYEKISK